MQLNWPDMRDQIIATLQDPRAGARRILALNMPQGTAALALFIMALLTGLVSAGLALIVGPGAPYLENLMPLHWVMAQTAGLFFFAWAMTFIGGWFGGRGTLRDAFALLAWAEVILLIVQIIQIIALFILPPVSMLLAMAQLALTFWLLSHFTAEMHGFANVAKVFLGIIGTGFALALILGALGGIPMAAMG